MMREHQAGYAVTPMVALVTPPAAILATEEGERRRLGKAKRAQHRGGSLGTRSDAQPTSLPLFRAYPVSSQ